MTKPRKRNSSTLEREVIVAVIILYALICATMLSIHYLQPAGQETKTSSTSPSHERFYRRREEPCRCREGAGRARSSPRHVDRFDMEDLIHDRDNTGRDAALDLRAFNPVELGRVWIRVTADDEAAIWEVCAAHRIEFPATLEGVGEDDDSIYLTVTLVVPAGDEFRQETVVFALSDRVVVTLEPPGRFAWFDTAIARFRRHPDQARAPYSVMRTLLQIMNDISAQSIELASASLEAMSDQIGRMTSGVDEHGREIGVSDISDTMLELN